MFAASKSGRSSAGGGGTTDPYFPYVPLLLETTSTNGQQNNTFLDSSTNNFTITRNGTPTQGSRTPYWPNGQWSNYFNGSSYIRSPGFNFSTSNFSIECFLNTAFLGAGPQFLSGYDFSGLNYTIAMNAGGTLGYFLSSDGSNWDIASNQIMGTVVANRWHHLVIARTGNKIRSYFDGVGGTVITTSAAINTNTTNFWLGAAGSAGGNLTGYLSNVRVLNGTSAYDANQSTITVPTAPFATGTTNQVLLTCQGNRFIDSNTATTAKTITVTGAATVQAFQPFSPTASYTTALYGGSGYFNGTSDYLTAPTNAAFGPGTNNFCVEFWIYPTVSWGSSGPILVATTNNGLWIGKNGANFVLRAAGVADLLSTTTLPTVNAWTHVAIMRSGATASMYFNGSRITTGTVTQNFVQTAFNICTDNTTNYIPTGYLSNLRLVNGSAVYDPTLTTLTVPTAPLTAITNTSLLLNMANAGIYDAAAQNDVTTVGDAQASTTQSKWSPTSMKFDGTGDWLTAVDNPQLQLGTGDFTIEGWVYLSAISVAYGIISKGTATTGWSVNVTALNKLQFSYTASVLTGATSLATGTWYYFAVVRSGSATGNLKIYLNGTADATSGGAVTDNFNQTSILYVGADRIGTSALNGYLQDIRITKGVGRTITASPTAAFPTK